MHTIRHYYAFIWSTTWKKHTKSNTPHFGILLTLLSVDYACKLESRTASALQLTRICQYDHPCNIVGPPNSWSGHIYFMTSRNPSKIFTIVVCGMSEEFMALNDGLMGLYTLCRNVFLSHVPPKRLRKHITLQAVKNQKTISRVNAGHVNLKNHILASLKVLISEVIPCHKRQAAIPPHFQSLHQKQDPKVPTNVRAVRSIHRDSWSNRINIVTK